MKAKEFVKLISGIADAYPDIDVTFANNKVPVNLVVYDDKSKTLNIR